MHAARTTREAAEEVEAVPIVEAQTVDPASREEHRTTILDVIGEQGPIDEVDLWGWVRSRLGCRYSEQIRDDVWDEILCEEPCPVQQNSSEHWELALLPAVRLEPPRVTAKASMEEHRKAIVALLKAVNVNGRVDWPKPNALRLHVMHVLLKAFDQQAYDRALASLKLTDPQWSMLKMLGEEPQPMHGKALVRVQNTLCDAGFAEKRYVAVADEKCCITDAGRERLAMGRGYR